MITFTPHPRHKYGLPTGQARDVNVSDWMKLHCGDIVCRRDDPRHCGRVEAIAHAAIVRVRWSNNGWYEDIEIGELRRAP